MGRKASLDEYDKLIILILYKARRPLTAGDIARILGVDGRSIFPKLDKMMVKRGFVERVDCNGKPCFRLTYNGVTLAKMIEREMLPWQT